MVKGYLSYQIAVECSVRDGPGEEGGKGLKGLKGRKGPKGIGSPTAVIDWENRLRKWDARSLNNEQEGCRNAYEREVVTGSTLLGVAPFTCGLSFTASVTFTPASPSILSAMRPMAAVTNAVSKRPPIQMTYS
jgi:hypothetical protein